MINYSMSESTLSERGQISVPAKLRRQMNLRTGQRFFWERISDRELRVVIETNDKPDVMAALGYARKLGRVPRSTADWMKELREGEETDVDG